MCVCVHMVCVCVCVLYVCVCIWCVCVLCVCVCVCLYLHVNGLTGWSLDNGSKIISTLSQKIWPTGYAELFTHMTSYLPMASELQM